MTYKSSCFLPPGATSKKVKEIKRVQTRGDHVSIHRMLGAFIGN